MTDLVLGTAQFGAQYGAMNTAGRLNDDLVSEICNAAFEGDIGTFDTSPYYGDAQQRLGSLLPASMRPTFVSKFGLDFSSELSFDAIVGNTLKDLQVDTLAGLLFHRVDDLRDPRATETYEVLLEARAAGIVHRFGASIYDLEDLEVALSVMPELDLLQLPGNIVDRRLLDHPALAEFHQRGGTVHVRSAYLQGVLLAPPDEVPPHLIGLQPTLRELHALAAELGRPLIELLLGYLKFHPVVDAVVVGALNAAEMRETVLAWKQSSKVEILLPHLDDALLDPRKWQKVG